MRNWKSITIIFAFILILFSARLAWNAYFSPSEQPYPIDGELDLRDIPFDDQRKVTLDGEWDIAPLQTTVLPLTIQPLVENAIRHGVAKQAKGTLTIRVSPEGVVTVKDDGIGMAQQFADTLLTRNFSKETGIGIRNTHLRLKKQYGSGLSVKTAPGEGTAFSFTLPLT
ncbi:sensor histidine kinase [Metalysinibacillus jejuensis]|uniref:sensor histidine kinase n=1 Tax=Metalysinibacillus jejuensis TaxID=914327 RepID=UPI000D347B69|nr:ATP-binding protein [Metalysinibacillus jejuensis]